MKFQVHLPVFAAMLLAACSAVEPPPTLTPFEQLGQSVYTLRCAQCHVLVPDTIVSGPSLAGIASRAGSRLPGYDAHKLRPGIDQRGVRSRRRVFDDLEIIKPRSSSKPVVL